MARRRRNELRDLDPYTGCNADEAIGLDPLAVGWLQHNRPFETGRVPADFVEKLLRFCRPEYTVCGIPATRPCAVERHQVEMPELDGRTIPLGTAEIRVIGDEDIYAAPTLIYHYVTAHGYRPPGQFIHAVRHGPQPDSNEFRALIRTLRQFS